MSFAVIGFCNTGEDGHTNVHHSASDGFTASAGTYVKGRPDYPPEVEEWLRSDLALCEGRAALDLGAGTGKFAPRLLATHASVLAVEPIPAMLEQLVRQYPAIDAKTGSAEHIPLADALVDAVVCAQSFHWFATPQALHEIHRVLKPGGAFGMLWNVRDESVPWVAALTRIMEPYAGDTPRYTSQKWRQLFPAHGFTPLCEQHFSNRHRGSPERVIVDRVLSVSFIAALPEDEQERVASQVRELIAASPELVGRAIVTFPYTTAAFSCRKL